MDSYKNLDTWYEDKRTLFGNQCRAPGVIESESEVFVSSETIGEAEEEPDLDIAFDELEAIKRRLLEMRATLVQIPPDPCVLSTVTPQGKFLSAPQIAMQQLRHENSILRCQVDRMVQHLMATRREIKSLEALRCQLGNRITSMSEQLHDFALFKQDAIHKFALCIERDAQIKACKVDHPDFGYNVTKVVRRNESTVNYLAPLRCHRQLIQTISWHMVFMRLFLHALLGHLVDEMGPCSRTYIM